jgi:salicylate hydroxylase
MHVRETAVIGAGIAGLTTAASLHKAGLHCRIFEQARDLRALGAGLQLSPNAVRVLHGLGLAADLRRDAVAVESLRFLRWSDDAPLACLPLGARGEQAFGAPYYAIHRADLHRALLATLPADVLELGAACSEVREEDERVSITFRDGRRVEADVAVGADGIHSSVRTGVANDTPRYTGHVIYRGLIEADRFPLLAKVPEVRVWLGPGQHLVSYPISAGRLIYFGATATLERWPVRAWSVPAGPGELAAAYRGWSDTVQTLIASAQEITCWALHDRPPLRRWGGRRTALVGDAAHSMLPFMAQAANQAIEDAVVLVSCLRGGIRTSASLRRYQRLRRPRVDRIHALSRANADLFHLADGGAQRDRDRTFGQVWNPEKLSWLFGYDAVRCTQWSDPS